MIKKTGKIAIIGTGISGNTAAWHLQKQNYDITVFEGAKHVGGHTHTHDIKTENHEFSIDTGFIVYNEKTYPHFISMLDELGVESQPAEMSFSVKHAGNGLEYNGHNLDTLFAQRRNLFKPSFLMMIKDIMRFNREAPASLNNTDANMSLGDYLKKHRYNRTFIHNYILPMGAAIWSTDPQKMQHFPARFFISFFNNHGLLQYRDRPQWYVIKNGSREYVKKLTASFKHRILTDTPVEHVKRSNGNVLIKARNREEEPFDAVFIATHSDQALKILGSNASRNEKSILGAIPYQRNIAILHTDKSLLPEKQKAWAAWNYHISKNPYSPVAVTYNMNRLQSLQADRTFCVTLNDNSRINPDKVIKTIEYQHPVFSPQSLQAQQRHSEINADGIYFCGAYWRNGFHEDGVVSALTALRDFKSSESNNEKLSLLRAS